MKRLLFAVVLLAGCRTSTPPEEPPFSIVDADAAAFLDAGPDASLCARACASMAAQGCVTAACLYACDRGQERHLVTELGLNCIANATSKDAIRACGTTCP